jgi:hypothetical protein
MRNEYIEDKVLLSNTIGELFDLIRSSNLLILKCCQRVTAMISGSLVFKAFISGKIN